MVQWMAQDSLNLGHGYAAFSTWGGVELDLMPGEPTADSPGIYPQMFCYVADAEITFHALSLPDKEGIKLNITIVRGCKNCESLVFDLRAWQATQDSPAGQN